ncbi:MAG: T9SS type A sorting domain-containing protein [Bacteroidales bacterium]|nr:T9SS type A sorting domain-containing protein [Bacteroidales bacterium]
MKLKKKRMFLWILLPFLLFTGNRVYAQTTVTLTFNNNTTQELTVDPAGKIYFENNYLYIDEGLGLPYSFAVENIRKITLPQTVGVDNITTEEFEIYPNPVQNTLHIHSGVGGQHPYQLYTLDGRLLLKGVCQEDETLNLQHLPSGLYLLKIGSSTIKISKL